jgi:hypothetical protein
LGVNSQHYELYPDSLRPSYRALLARFLDGQHANHRRLFS